VEKTKKNRRRAPKDEMASKRKNKASSKEIRSQRGGMLAVVGKKGKEGLERNGNKTGRRGAASGKGQSKVAMILKKNISRGKKGKG